MITIDYTDRAPIYEQIVNSIEKLIALGVMKQDDKLPSVRALGIELSINPNTVQKAYTMLESRGSIYSVKGIGNFVSKNDLKTKKIEEILNDSTENLKKAITYGLKEEELNIWFTKTKEALYDNSN
ncbi:MAG: GntR family transcriptional regulator [Clostridia bacterium]